MASIPKIYSPREIISLNPSRSTDQMLVSLIGSYRSISLGLGDMCPNVASLLSQNLMSLTRVYGSATSALEGDLAGVRPDQLPSWFFISHPSVAMEGWKTDHGNWLPKKLVSIPNTFQGNSPNFPKLVVGAKATLEFKPTDGSKAVFGMTRYNMLTVGKYSDGLYLDEELSLCHVYPLGGKGKGVRNRNGKRRRSGSAADQSNDFAPPPFGDLEQEISEFDFTECSPLDVDDYGVDVPDLPSTDSSKHPRLESKHWHNFTKIYTKNPELMYAACNHCDTMLKLKGGSSCGTGSLRHHNDSCRCKPKQEQLPGNSSSMSIPSIAL